NGLPRLEVHKSHSPTNFRSPGFGSFTIDVFNAAATSSPTFGPLKVVDTLTAGVTILGILAPGWACGPAIGGTFQCVTSQVVAAGAHATPITVLVGIGANPPQAVQNTATVSGVENLGAAQPIFMTPTDRVQITRWFHFF